MGKGAAARAGWGELEEGGEPDWLQEDILGCKLGLLQPLVCRHSLSVSPRQASSCSSFISPPPSIISFPAGLPLALSTVTPLHFADSPALGIVVSRSLNKHQSLTPGTPGHATPARHSKEMMLRLRARCCLDPRGETSPAAPGPRRPQAAISLGGTSQAGEALLCTACNQRPKVKQQAQVQMCPYFTRAFPCSPA